MFYKILIYINGMFFLYLLTSEVFPAENFQDHLILQHRCYDPLKMCNVDLNS